MPYELIKKVPRPTDPFLHAVLHGHYILISWAEMRVYVLGRGDRPLGYVAEDKNEAEGKRKGLLRPLNFFDNFRPLPENIGIYREVKPMAV